LTYNAWHHVHYVYDGTQAISSARLRLWIDATEQTLTVNGTIPASLPNITDPLVFGKNGTSYSTCQLAEVGMWPNVAITDAETIFPLSFGFTPEHFGSRGLRFYSDLVRQIQDQYGGATPFVTGTSVNTHGRIISPCASQAIIKPAFRGLSMFGGN
jgi:hypothetical protein